VGVLVFSWSFEVVAGRGRGEEENWESGGRSCLCGTGRRKKRLKKVAGSSSKKKQMASRALGCLLGKSAPPPAVVISSSLRSMHQGGVRKGNGLSSKRAFSWTFFFPAAQQQHIQCFITTTSAASFQPQAELKKPAAAGAGAPLQTQEPKNATMVGSNVPSFQQAIHRLQDYWASIGCAVMQSSNTEVGAGTMNPATFLRVLGPEPWNVAYVEPSVRPDDSRYGDNPNRVQCHTQFQVILKPDPGNSQELYLGSLAALGK
jgi:hypothetical protein